MSADNSGKIVDITGRETVVSVKKVLDEVNKNITPEQIVEAYRSFLGDVNKPVHVYTHTKKNLDFLCEKIIAEGGEGALLFPESYLIAFHRFANELPDPLVPIKTEAELVLERQKKERERVAELETRDRYAGRDPGHRSEVEIAATAEAQQKAFEDLKKSALERRQEIVDSWKKDVAPPTMKDAYDALLATGFEPNAVKLWLIKTPNDLVREVRRMKGMAAKIDQVQMVSKEKENPNA